MAAPTPRNVAWGYAEAAQPKTLRLVAATVATIGVDWSYVIIASTNTLRFTSHHVGPVTTWTWDFGDGSNPVNVVNPQHTFEIPTGAGSVEFDVRLTVDGGVFEEKTLTIIEPPQQAAGVLDAWTLTAEEAFNMTAEQAFNMIAQ